MRIGDRVYVRGYVDEIRKDTVIIHNNGGYFGTVAEEIEIIIGEITRCKDCKKYDAHGHRYKYWNHGVAITDYCSYGEKK